MAIGSVFSEPRRLMVPIYQRAYEWTPDGQIETLMDHIESKAEARLANEPSRFLHYMGALLLIPRSGFVFGRIPVLDIVDGQQRITTFQIALAALRDLASARGEQAIADQIRPLLFNLDEASMQDKAAERFKLEPTRSDRDVFRHLMAKPFPELREAYADYFTQAGSLRKTGEPRPPKALAAWCYVRERAVEFMDAEGSPGERLRALLQAMLQDIHLIVITLAETDDAQVIFETLNFGGKPLAAMDLVRNDVFNRAVKGNEDVEALMETGWSVFEEKFWKEEATQGRIKKPRMDFFLAHALAAETGKETLLNELYAAYKQYVRERKYANVEEELQTLRRYVPTYKALALPGTGPLGRLAYALDRFDTRTAYPLVMAINAATIDENAREGAYRLIESYVVRRALCRLTPKNFNTIFLRLATVVREKSGSLEALSAAFLEYTGDSNRFPSDEDLRAAFEMRPVYEDISRYRLWYILRELEFASRDKYSETVGLKEDLEVEHVLPQSWYEHWPLPDGSTASADLTFGLSDQQRAAAVERRSLVHTMGNLTLLTKPANIEVLNYSFGEKRKRLKASLLQMNQIIAGNPEWTEAAIRTRSAKLAELAIAIWPAPRPPETVPAGG